MQVADIVNACLEVLDDLVSKYGSAIEAEHVQMEQALLTLIQQNKASHRKRALHCLGNSFCFRFPNNPVLLKHGSSMQALIS